MIRMGFGCDDRACEHVRAASETLRTLGVELSACSCCDNINWECHVCKERGDGIEAMGALTPTEDTSREP